MKRYLPFLIVGLVAALAFGGGFALYRSKQTAAPTGAKDGATTGLHVRGKKDAAVTIEEFGDFECPPCSKMAVTLKKIEEEYGSRVRFIFHHFPLINHKHARPAAHAAEAADMQGRFWDMHDLLYKEQNNWSHAQDVFPLLHGYAGAIGLDVERFKKDMESETVQKRVDADHQLGSSRGVSSTPTVFVNNVAVPPASLDPSGLRKAITTALEEKGKTKP
ncbi:MAG TPA: thioredoxin domain-containing protein [Chthoniobacterales bacterium]|jgi:protein-disulfide isomerase|nr:thioredoxin domain-containing protein [Chthoniobacterales bacterium]